MRKFTYVIVATASLLGLDARADQAADAARCQSLRNQVDRHAFATRTEGDFKGRLEREIGVDLCRRGQYADGIRELEKAIRLLGYTPN